MRLLVTGADGQLGSELLRAADGHFEIVGLTIDDLNVTEKTAIEQSFARVSPAVVINCAAYTAVDGAEKDKDTAFKVNEGGTRNVAQACADHNIPLIHISTDFVFDGKKNLPYKEDDETNPLGVYGASKLASEEAAFESHSRCVVIRTSWLYSAFGSNFARTMLRLGREKDKINVVEDQLGRPTSAKDLAAIMLELVEKHEFESNVLYHFSNDGIASWYDFAQAVIDLAGLNTPVIPITSEEFVTPAKRPRYSCLDLHKIHSHFNLPRRHWRHALEDTMSELREQNL